jgi:hypothetical protein
VSGPAPPAIALRQPLRRREADDHLAVATGQAHRVRPSRKETLCPASATITLRLTAACRAMLKSSTRIKPTTVGVFAPKHGKTITERNPITLTR